MLIIFQGWPYTGGRQMHTFCGRHRILSVVGSLVLVGLILHQMLGIGAKLLWLFRRNAR